MILGLKPAGFKTGDYFPLFPYFGLVLLGVYLGRILYERYSFSLVEFPKLNAFCSGSVGGVLQWLGQHSLMIYLIHQPVLLFLFYTTGLLKTF